MEREQVLLTLPVRCVFLYLPAQLRHIGPSSSTSGLVQLLDVALRFLVLRGVLCWCKLWAQRNDVALEVAAPLTHKAVWWATYHHDVKDMTLALRKVAIHAQSCSSSNIPCDRSGHGHPHVTDRLQLWSHPAGLVPTSLSP